MSKGESEVTDSNSFTSVANNKEALKYETQQRKIYITAVCGERFTSQRYVAHSELFLVNCEYKRGLHITKSCSCILTVTTSVALSDM